MNPSSSWEQLWPLARPQLPGIVLGAVTAFLGALVEAAFLIGVTASLLALAGGVRMVAVGPFQLTLEAALGGGAVLLALRLVLGLLALHIGATMTATVTQQNRVQIARAFINASWEVQQSEPAGRLQELLVSFVYRITTAMQNLVALISAALNLVAFVGTGILVQPMVTGVMLGALAVLATVLAPVRRWIRRDSGAQARAAIEFGNTIAEMSALGSEMHTLGVRHQFSRRIERISQRNADLLKRVQILTGSLAPVYTFLAYAAVLGGISATGSMGGSQLAASGSVALLLLRSLSYGQQLVSVGGTLSATTPYLSQLATLRDHYASNRASGGTTIPFDVAPLSMDGVSYRYNVHRPPALTGLSLTIERGEMLGVIGPSGSGKSTLAQLLLGLRTPTDGAVSVHDTDLRQVSREWWTRRVAFVAQEALLFTGTVAENIRFFRDGITDEAIQLACVQANVLRDIQSLPDGFDTHLGERGSSLSGGQRQRLSLARALVTKPELLILDEPTSALDGNSESLIRDTLADLHGQTTIVIIAHRMSTLDLCDRIMVIESGRVTGLDVPATLLDSNHFYRQAITAAGIGGANRAEST